MLGIVAMAQAFAQVPRSPDPGRAPVPNVRAPLPPAVPPSAGPAPADNAVQRRSSASSEAERPRQGATGVGRVVDGDTLRLEGRTYRLWGIDAPELIQVCQRDGQGYACGREAAAYLRALLSGNPAAGDSTSTGGAPPLVCAPRTSDQYGRAAALCRLGDKDLGAEMVRAGWALAFTRHSSDYAPEEDEARQERRGLWAGTFDTPWDWRAKRQGE